jgi:hydrogenase 3 maturation protease
MDTLIMCIGNRDGGDDAIGPYIGDKVKSFKNNNLVVIDCNTVPENYTSVVKKYKPENLVIIDAVEMGLKPGEIRTVPEEKIGKMHVSTHGIPISVLIMYLKEQNIKNVVLIGIQPKIMSGKLTRSVRKSGDILIELIKNKDFMNIEKLR